MLELLKTADAFRRPERFAELLEVAQLADPGVDTALIHDERIWHAKNGEAFSAWIEDDERVRRLSPAHFFS